MGWKCLEIAAPLQGGGEGEEKEEERRRATARWKLLGASSALGQPGRQLLLESLSFPVLIMRADYDGRAASLRLLGGGSESHACLRCVMFIHLIGTCGGGDVK